MNKNPCTNQKFHVLFEQGLKNSSNKPRSYFMTLYAESAADQTEHLADALVCANLVYGYDVVMMLYDVRKFTVNGILFREIQCKKREILMY